MPIRVADRALRLIEAAARADWASRIHRLLGVAAYSAGPLILLPQHRLPDLVAVHNFGVLHQVGEWTGIMQAFMGVAPVRGRAHTAPRSMTDVHAAPRAGSADAQAHFGVSALPRRRLLRVEGGQALRAE